VTRRFRQFACIDWSGAATPLQPGIALAVCAEGSAAPMLVAPPARHWSRPAILYWLLARAEEQADMIVGVDFSAALPFDPDGGYFPGLADSPPNARALWRHVDMLCAGDPHLAAGGYVTHADLAPFFRVGAITGARFASSDGNGRLRVVERRAGSGHPAFCFNLVGAKQVGRSSLTGMRLLHQLGGRIPIWPFDDVPTRGPLLVEIYTSIAARAAGRPNGRAKMRTITATNDALAMLGSAPHPGTGTIDDHSSDAIVTAAWLRAVADQADLWHPAGLDAVRHTEGWTFGVS
jgi:hypothetical protein